MAFYKSKRHEKTLTPDEALAKLEHFCAYQERCPKEVRNKLAQLGVRGETADRIFGVLQGDGFFDEKRFAIAYAGGKFRINRWGRVRIRQELYIRDISPAVIGEALETIDEAAYLETLKQQLEKKRGQYGADNPRAREKTAAALIRAGFEQELVFKYL